MTSARSSGLPLLDRIAIGCYLDARFEPHDFPSELAELIARTTEGHPLFVTRLVQLLLDRGDIRLSGGRHELARAVTELEPRAGQPPAPRPFGLAVATGNEPRRVEALGWLATHALALGQLDAASAYLRAGERSSASASRPASARAACTTSGHAPQRCEWRAPAGVRVAPPRARSARGSGSAARVRSGPGRARGLAQISTPGILPARLGPWRRPKPLRQSRPF